LATTSTRFPRAQSARIAANLCQTASLPFLQPWRTLFGLRRDSINTYVTGIGSSKWIKSPSRSFSRLDVRSLRVRRTSPPFLSGRWDLDETLHCTGNICSTRKPPRAVLGCRKARVFSHAESLCPKHNKASRSQTNSVRIPRNGVPSILLGTPHRKVNSVCAYAERRARPYCNAKKVRRGSWAVNPPRVRYQ